MNTATIRELECFLAVAEELSFTNAARRLRLAQPPLSRHIRNLEEKLDVVLFDRSNRRVALTSGGEAFRIDAREILIQLQKAGDSARRAARGETERLEVGFVSAVLSPELVLVFTKFRTRHPEVRMHLHDRLPAEQLSGVENGELDLGFVGIAPVDCKGDIAVTSWMDEPLLAFLPPGHRLSDAERISVADLSDEPFVMISREAAPAFRSHVETICEAAGFRPRVTQEGSRGQAVAAMTVVGSGVSLLPATLNRVTGNGVGLRRSRKWATTVTHSVVHRASPNTAVRAFLKQL